MLSDGGWGSTVICASSQVSPSSLLSLQMICSLWISLSSSSLDPLSDFSLDSWATGSSQQKREDDFVQKSLVTQHLVLNIITSY